MKELIEKAEEQGKISLDQIDGGEDFDSDG